MPTDSDTNKSTFEAAAHETLVASLRNAHALEKQVISVLEAQLKLFDDYPDLHTKVTEHIVDTRDQARRLQAVLEACGASNSMIKDALLSVMGMGQSSVQSTSDDAVLKAVGADMMTEHLEIATYRMLLTLADLAGKPEIRSRLEETLREEEAMADWFDQNLEAITRRFVELKASERRMVEPPVQDEIGSADGEPDETVWQSLESAEQSDAYPKPNADHAPDDGRSTTASESNQSEGRSRPVGAIHPAD